MDFEWDPSKALYNLEKHGVSFPEATEVFGDAFSFAVVDPDHSETEARFLLFGRSRRGRFVVISFTDRGGKIRLISARHDFSTSNDKARTESL